MDLGLFTLEDAIDNRRPLCIFAINDGIQQICKRIFLLELTYLKSVLCLTISLIFNWYK